MSSGHVDPYKDWPNVKRNFIPEFSESGNSKIGLLSSKKSQKTFVVLRNRDRDKVTQAYKVLIRNSFKFWSKPQIFHQSNSFCFHQNEAPHSCSGRLSSGKCRHLNSSWPEVHDWPWNHQRWWRRAHPHCYPVWWKCWGKSLRYLKN